MQGVHLEHLAWVTREAVPLGPTGHLLYKTTLPRLGNIADLPNIINKHREAAKMMRQRNMSQMKEQNRTSEKELNKMDANKLPDTEFKAMVIKMLE